MSFLSNIRETKSVPFGKLVLQTAVFLLLGLLLGFASKWLDLNNEFFGNLFSRIMIWFVLCTAISVYSKRPLSAMLKVFAFCIGMLATYYLAAIWWDADWSKTFMYGWLAFSLCSPILAFFTWYAKGKGVFALLLKAGILVIAPIAESLMFGFRAYNLLMLIALAIILFENHSQKGANYA